MALRRVAVVLATLLLACGARGKPVVDFFSGREDATIGGAPVMGGSDPIEYGDSPNIFERMVRISSFCGTSLAYAVQSSDTPQRGARCRHICPEMKADAPFRVPAPQARVKAKREDQEEAKAEVGLPRQTATLPPLAMAAAIARL